MTDETVSAWWNSPDVREARNRAQYDDGDGTLADVMERLLEVVDEREAELDALPPAPVGKAFHLAAVAFDKHGRVTGDGEGHGALYVNAAITQMLDLGADVDRLKTVFNPDTVDRIVAKWASWRETVVTAARNGASSDEIKDLVPGVTWNPHVRRCLEVHGFDLPAPRDRRRTAGARQRAVIDLKQAGHTILEIAATVGCSRQNVTNILRNHREGRLQLV